MPAVYFSVVIPVFNEAVNLPELHRRLSEALRKIGKSYEIIFVDDGSTDDTYSCLERLHQADSHVRVLRFSRNFGHHIAITAGMDAARGESTVLMDGDLQDLPEEIERLYEKFREGYDVVYGIRAEKKHSWFKRVTSRLFLAVMNRIVSGSHSINTNIFRMMRRNVVDAVRQCRERSRFVVGLVSWVGFRQTGVEVRHGERAAGTTKYSLRKMVRLALDAVTSFSSVPLQVATHLGVVVSVGSLLIVAALLVRGLVAGAWVPAAIFVGVGILFVCGVELVCLGVIGEYLGRTYAETRQRPLYVIDRLLEQSDGAGHEAR